MAKAGMCNGSSSSFTFLAPAGRQGRAFSSSSLLVVVLVATSSLLLSMSTLSKSCLAEAAHAHHQGALMEGNAGAVGKENLGFLHHGVQGTGADYEGLLMADPEQAVETSVEGEPEMDEDQLRLQQYLLRRLAAIAARFQQRGPGPQSAYWQMFRNNNEKRGIDFGTRRGYSGNLAARYLMGMAFANSPNSPGRK